jgi:hypothetical protein
MQKIRNARRQNRRKRFIMWLYIIIGVFLVAMGLAVHVFKWYFLISGYNTMSREKKANVDTKGLSRLIGIYFYVNGGVLIAMGVLNALGFRQVLAPSIIFFSISTVYLLIKAQKYDGNVYDERGKLRKGIGKKFALSSGITIAAVILVVVLLLFSSRPTKVTLIDDGVQIHGMYGDTYAWDSIITVKLIEELPTIEMRTNGSALGPYLKGHFRTKELGSVKLFVNAQKHPFIYLETDDRITIFNVESEDETREIFKEILEKTN